MKSVSKSSKDKKVFVGMSGGVDSSVSAALLKQAGYDVTGVFIKVWHPNFLPCNWRAERLDAMRVAAKLGIGFLTLDLEKEYKREVVDYMISEYKSGRTPNPDVMCNKEIKFGAFLAKALSMGADYIATGHYAENIHSKSKDVFELHESKDKEKDQSYFLWTLTQKQLKQVLFPVGGMTKPEVRKLAQRFGLSTAAKKDSQGLCFIGHVDMKEFLKNYLRKDKAAQQGNVLDGSGQKIGTHDGAIFYTIGQRHGFTVFKKTTADAPFYVIEKDMKKNAITVSDKKIKKTNESKASAPPTEICLEKTSWITDVEPDLAKTYKARIRYRQPLGECKIKKSKNGSCSVSFKLPQEAVSPGQSVVIYDKTRCIGGGVIV